MSDETPAPTPLTRQSPITIGLSITMMIGLVWIMTYTRSEVSDMRIELREYLREQTASLQESQKESNRRQEILINRLAEITADVRVLTASQAALQDAVNESKRDLQSVEQTVQRLESQIRAIKSDKGDDR